MRLLEQTSEDRFPQWIRVPTSDWDSAAGRYMLAGGSQSNWADYGRWCALRQILATTKGAFVDVTNDRQLGALSRQLGFASRRACRSWLDALAECEAISPPDYAEGLVVSLDVAAQQRNYVDRVETNRRNRSRARPSDPGGDQPDAHESLTSR